jgi:hypothetical protein
VEKAVGKEAKIEILPEQPGDVDRTCADINKARELLGYSPKVPFEEGIRRTAEWFRDATEQGLFDDPVSETAAGAAATERERGGSMTSMFSVVSEGSSVQDHEALAAAAVAGGVLSRSPSRQGIAEGLREVVVTPQRIRHTTRSTHQKRHVFIHKISSDLELSSYVQKAPVQVRSRATRLL